MRLRCRGPCGRHRDKRWRDGERSLAETLAKQGLQFGAMKAAKAEVRQRAAVVRKILPADRAANSKESFGQWRGDPREFSDRGQKRQTQPQILPHITVFGQNDPLAPVTGVSETVVRAAAIHPDLTVGRVMVGQRKVWSIVT